MRIMNILGRCLQSRRNGCNGKANKEIMFSKKVLDNIRSNAGRYHAETGGFLASTADQKFIDRCYFDINSKNTPRPFCCDKESMSAVFRKWKAKGYVVNGIYLSHPRGCILPSYRDLSATLQYIRAFNLNYFYLSILQPNCDGFFKLYFYVVRATENILIVTLEYVIEAKRNGYAFIPFVAWMQFYSIHELDMYRDSREQRNKAYKCIGKKSAMNCTILPVAEIKEDVRHD